MFLLVFYSERAAGQFSMITYTQFYNIIQQNKTQPAQQLTHYMHKIQSLTSCATFVISVVFLWHFLVLIWAARQMEKEDVIIQKPGKAWNEAFEWSCTSKFRGAHLEPFSFNQTLKAPDGPAGWIQDDLSQRGHLQGGVCPLRAMNKHWCSLPETKRHAYSVSKCHLLLSFFSRKDSSTGSFYQTHCACNCAIMQTTVWCSFCL